MEIDEKTMKNVIGKAHKNPVNRRVTGYSHKALVLLRYIDLTTPMFSKGGVASTLLQTKVEKEYPVLYSRASMDFEETEQQDISPILELDLENIDQDILEQAKEETSSTSGKTIAIYNPRVATVLRYLAHVTPRYKVSGEVGRLIEARIVELKPDVWKAMGMNDKEEPICC